MWRIMLVLSAGMVVAGCSQQAPSPPPPPAPDHVVVNTVCAGVEQAYWHGSWWEGFSSGQHGLRGEGPEREIDGSMTATGAGRAQLTSAQLVAPQAMSDTPDTRPDVPPLPCGLGAPG